MLASHSSQIKAQPDISRLKVDEASHEPANRARRLAGVLLVKAACDLTFVAALVIAFLLTVFDMSLDGRFEVTNGYVTGQIRAARGGEPLELQLFVNGKFIAHQVADCGAAKADAGHAANEPCRFRFPLPELERGEHEARIYAMNGETGGVRRAMQLVGAPQRFTLQP